MQTVLSRLPAEAGGIALNLAGLGSWAGFMCELHPVLLPIYDSVCTLVISLAYLIHLAMALQALLANAHLRGELKKPKQCGSYGGLLMSLTLCASYVRFVASTDTALVLVHISACLQVAMLLWYLGWTAYVRSPPVPYWFPATVGVGAAGIAGSKVGMDPALQQAFFWLSAILCAIEWPWITARCLHSDRIAPAPSVFVHAAPVSLVSLAFMDVIVAPMHDALTPAVLTAAHFFLAATTLAALTTLFFAYRRRAILRQFILPCSECLVHQEWSGLTFPLVATSAYAIAYAARIGPLLTRDAQMGAQTAATVWATALGIFTIALVTLIDFFYFVFGVPCWLYKGLPSVPAPPAYPDSAPGPIGERLCCVCCPPLGGSHALTQADLEKASQKPPSRLHVRSGTSMATYTAASPPQGGPPSSAPRLVLPSGHWRRRDHI